MTWILQANHVLVKHHWWWRVMKRVFCFMAVMALLVSGCARAATRSGWSPIDQAEASDTATVLPVVLAATLTPAPIATSGSTIQPVGTLDVSSLPSALPAAMKGYDIYSWQIGNDWSFTLITSTNRTKSFDEITAPGNSVKSDGFVKISVSGIDDLEKVLQLLPEGQSILWGGMDLGTEAPDGKVYLTFPPASLMSEVSAYCTSLQLTLTSLKNQ